MAEAAPEGVALAAGGLQLRPYRRDDGPVLYAAVCESIASVGRWLPWCHAGYSISDAEDWITLCDEGWRKGEHFAFGVFDVRGEFCGGVGLNQRNRLYNFMSLGYWIRQSRQGRGIGRLAARRVIDFGFAELGLTRIEIIIRPDNAASRRVATAAGAKFECIASNRIVMSGSPAEAAVYSIVPEDAAAGAAPV
jgi:RimJ/RimL family protein N-acetyltransferase